MSKKELVWKNRYNVLRTPGVLNPFLIWLKKLSKEDYEKCDDFVKALFQIFVKRENGGYTLLLSTVVCSYKKDIKTGFCWSLLATQNGITKKEVVTRFENAIKTSFGYAKVLYGKWMVKQRDADYKRAYCLFEKAAVDHNDSDGWFYMGKHCQQGLGCAKDDRYGFKCYKKSAHLGKEKVALCYSNGTGTRISYTKSLKWYLLIHDKDVQKKNNKIERTDY